MSKVTEFFKNEHIQVALVTGLCIIGLALYFKKLLHMPVPGLESVIPGFMFTGFELAKHKAAHPFWRRPLPWNVLAIVVTGLVALRHLL